MPLAVPCMHQLPQHKLWSQLVQARTASVQCSQHTSLCRCRATAVHAPQAVNGLLGLIQCHIHRMWWCSPHSLSV